MPKQNFKTQNWKETFKHAIDGCRYAFLTQKNFKVHFGLSTLVIGLAIWLAIPVEQFILIILAIFLGLTFEMGNTVFEKVVDLITEKYHPTAKIAKDVSAGMMLLISLGLAILGILILLPPLLQKIAEL